MQKGFVQFIILGVVILAVVAAGAFFLGKQSAAPKPQPQTSVMQPTISQLSPSPTTDATANWKTYTGKSLLNFMLKYPPEWGIREDFNKSDNYYQQVYFESIPLTKGNFDEIFKSNFPGDPNTTRIKGTSFSVAISEFDGNQTPEEYAENLIGGFRTNNKSPKVVDGITGLMYSPDAKDSGKSKGYRIYVPKGKLMYIIMFDSADNLDNIFSQIVSTLKFTN